MTDATESHETWFEDDEAALVDASFKDYQITSTPNDFNVKTICDFIESGVVQIPNFQRNYVWDIERASKLIESLLIGLPIPQIFLYEKSRNSFLVIDGQQRLMSIYYFFKGRFPRMDKRLSIRKIMSESNVIPKGILSDDNFFHSFELVLPGPTPNSFSRFHEKNYETLEEYQVSFNLATIRNVVIKQTSPQEGDDSSVFEIFHRLNTGGINLSPQEIRSSLYHSDFMEMLDRLTFEDDWLHITGKRQPDINLKDTEVLLRAFAMLVDGDQYREPMAGLINGFSKKARAFQKEEISYAESLLKAFLARFRDVNRSIFSVTDRVRFNIALFECVFRVFCKEAFDRHDINVKQVEISHFNKLKNDQDLVKATRFSTGQTSNVKLRYEKAREYLQ